MMAGGAAQGRDVRNDTYKEARVVVGPCLGHPSVPCAASCFSDADLFIFNQGVSGGVIWEFSFSAYDQFFCDRGLFGDEACKIEWNYIIIFWRSIWQAGLATIFCLIVSFPDRLLHCHPTTPHALYGCF